MKALLLSAGLGTRLGNLTEETPKPMIEIAGKPVLDHLVTHLYGYGITDILINVHHKKDVITEYFGDKLTYIYEPVLLGDVASTKKIVYIVSDDIVVMNGDTLTDIDIHAMHRDACIEKASISSFEDMTYTGTTLFLRDYRNRIVIKEYGCYWQDIGTLM